MIFTQGVDQYPKSQVDAHHVLANWKQVPRNLVCLTSGNHGVQFTNMAITEPELMTPQKNSQHNNKNLILKNHTTKPSKVKG